MNEMELRRKLQAMADGGAEFGTLANLVDDERASLDDDAFHELWLYAWALTRTRRRIPIAYGEQDSVIT